jgi:hypothetical protein
MLTAIDILFEKIEKIPFQSPDAGALYDDIIKLYEESKEIEKEQIIKTRLDIYTTCDLSSEQYYNETFKK